MARNQDRTEVDTRIDKKLVRSSLRTVLGMDAWLKQTIEEEGSQIQQLRAGIQELISEETVKTLQSLDIEQINQNKQGIRVAVLREAGITNIQQVNRMSLQKLIDLDGIGEQSARKIKEIAQEITEKTRESTNVRLSVDNQSPASTKLVKATYVLMRSQSIRERSRALFEEYHTQIVKRSAAAKPALKGLSWLFTSKTKKISILQDIDWINGLLDGAFYRDTTELQKAYQRIKEASSVDAWKDFSKKSADYYAFLDNFDDGRVKQDTGTGLPEELSQQVDACPLDTSLLRCTLRRYQTFGVKYILTQQKVLLGDEMGLGKTIQAISAMASLKAAGKTHFMVVCPASVLVNWCREVGQHSELQAVKIHGNDEAALEKWLEEGGVAVTTYESISRFTLPQDFFFSMLVADEAHYVKNPEANRTKALLKLLQRTERVLFMTGTPMENKVEEMCFLVGSLQPEVGRALEGIKYLSTAPQFREKLAPVYLRRTREDVLTELPDLIETEDWNDLQKEEYNAYYDAAMARNFMAMRQVSWQVKDLSASTKANRLLEICQQAKEENRKILVFSFFLDTIRKVCALLGDRCLGPITGSISPQKRQELVDAFGEAPAGTVLVSQVQAGGTGLNIQSASVVVFCEPQIKPSIENQAIARAYRMGQVRNVQVYRLLCEDSIDERIIEILRQKQELFDNFADESVVGTESMHISEQAWIDNMIDAEIQRLTKGKKP